MYEDQERMECIERSGKSTLDRDASVLYYDWAIWKGGEEEGNRKLTYKLIVVALEQVEVAADGGSTIMEDELIAAQCQC